MLLSPYKRHAVSYTLLSASHCLIGWFFIQLCELPVSSPCFFWLFSAALCVSDLSPFSGMSRLGVYLLSPQKCFYCSVIVFVLFVFNICTCKTQLLSLSLFSLTIFFTHTFCFSLAVFFFFWWLLRVSWRWIVFLSINDFKNGKVRRNVWFQCSNKTS